MLPAQPLPCRGDSIGLPMSDEAHRTPVPVLVRVWLALTAVFPWILVLLARNAHKRQYAEAGRFSERVGRASVARTNGPLIWIHAASVGEVGSVARLGQELMDQHGVALLVTTATATGGATVGRLLPGALHQFLPVDTPASVSRFLDHWRPDAALFVEGDLWPRMLQALDHRQCPMALLNVRASRSRDRFPAVYSMFLSHMRLVTVQEPGLIDGLKALGLDPVRLQAPGNLKADVAVPAIEDNYRSQIVRAALGRGVWTAVSTHAGEEDIVLDAHAGLTDSPLLLLVPRHPDRGDDLAAKLERRGLRYTRHSKGGMPDKATQVHLVDALGETGTVYAAAGLAFIGGSLLPGFGGHTPFEPAALGCVILFGPHVNNFTDAFKSLQASGAALCVTDADTLGAEVATLLRDDDRLEAMQTAARAQYEAQGGATKRTLDMLAPIISHSAKSR